MNSEGTSGIKDFWWIFQELFTYISVIYFPISVNIALNKQAYQSSTYTDPQGAAEGAVDGNIANDWENGDHCSHTDKEMYAWWAVDLRQV